MNLLILGLNHNTAPLSLREKVSYGPDELKDSINMIRAMLSPQDKGGISEAAILSTCNRTEIYCAAQDPEKAARSLREFIAEQKQVQLAELEEHLYLYIGEEAARHAFRVASGLDSMVLGETQIVGQIKKAEKTAQEARSLGLHLHHLFQKTFSVAKEVRSTTEIGTRSISLAAAAVRVANRIFGNISDSNILFVGAGEMIELCAAHFCAQNPKKVTVANRTVERAQALADQIGADAIKLSDMPEVMADYDIVVSCTASSLPIIGLGMAQRAIKKRRHHPMFMVDLAVPRDIEAEISNLDDIYVYTVDDLGKVVQAGIKGRQEAVKAAEVLIQERVNEFHVWISARNSVPQIISLKEKAEALREREIKKARRALAKGEDPEKVLEHMSKSLMNKFIHDPLTTLRNNQSLPDEDYQKVLDLLQNFFLYHGH